MALGDKDYTLEPQLPELWLATSTRTIIAKLNNRSGIGFARFGKRQKFLKHTQLYKLNSISELEFSVPYQIEMNHELVRNDVVDKINESSLIKSIHNGIEEWFTIVNITKTMDIDKDVFTVQCRSLGYELMRRYVRNFKVVSQNLSSLCLGGSTVNVSGDTFSYNGILQGTLWGLASDTDATFDTIFRSVDISKATILDALIQICKTFNAILVFDTINRKISFQQLKNIGQDKGAKISYELYMKSLQNDSKTDLIVTRFVPYGKNGLTINAITGSSHIDDFSFWTQGFTRDVNKVVLTHSPHMSDSLCGAIIDYIALQQAYSGDFNNLIKNLSSYQTTLTQQKNDLISLNTTLDSIHKQLDIAQTTGLPTATLLSQQTSQQALITSKQSDIDTTNANITATNNSISSLQATMSTNANFTQAQQQELIPFIHETEWTDNNITDAQDLYNQALIQFTKYKTPQIILKVDMTNIFEEITEQRVWDKFWVGNDVLVEYDVLGTSVKSKIIEMNFDHADGNLQIVVASVVDLLRQEEQVYNMLYQSVSAANTLSVNLDSWGQIDVVAKNVNALYDKGIDSSKVKINAGADNTIVINNRGLSSTVSSDPNSLIRLNNGVLGFSSNGGNTFSVAISAQGIFANKLTGQILIGANLLIANQSGSFSVDGNGVTISGAALIITGKLPDSQIGSAGTWNNAVGQGVVYNGVKIDSTNGLVITSTDGKVKALFNATDGLKFSTSSNGVTYTDRLYYNATTGNLTLNGDMSVVGSFKINGAEVLTSNGTKISGTYIDSITTGQIVVTSTLPDSAISSATNWNQKTTLITSGGVYTGTVYANQIAVGGGTIPDSLLSSSSSWNGKTTLINGSGIYTGSLTANQITAGTMTADKISGGTLSGVTVNVGTNLTVGNQIYIGQDQSSSNGNIKSVYFNSGANISNMSDGISYAGLKISAARIRMEGTVDMQNVSVLFNGATIQGLTCVYS